MEQYEISLKITHARLKICSKIVTTLAKSIPFSFKNILNRHGNFHMQSKLVFDGENNKISYEMVQHIINIRKSGLMLTKFQQDLF